MLHDMDTVVDAFQQIRNVLLCAPRLFARHWPTLLTLFFLGAAGHGAFLWIATAMSAVNPLISTFVIPLAPLSTLVALVLMLRTLASSIPELQEARRGGLRKDLALAVHVLVPFLAAYAAQGLLEEDVRTYASDAMAHEWMDKGFQADFAARVSFGDEGWLFAIALVAVVARKALDLVLTNSSRGWLHALRGYLEALWLTTLAWVLAQKFDIVTSWFLSRKAVATLIDTYYALAEFFGPVGEVVDRLLGGPSGMIATVIAFVVIPFAWIAISATTYGTSLFAPSDLHDTPEEVKERINKTSNLLKRAVANLVEPLMSPVILASQAIKNFASMGPFLMIMLCMIIAATSKLRLVVHEGARLILGPHPLSFWEAVSPYIDMVAQCVYTCAMVVLLAATVQAVVLAPPGSGHRVTGQPRPRHSGNSTSQTSG